MAISISGALHGTDYGDTFTTSLEPATYDYTLKVSGGGKVSFKVEELDDPFPIPDYDTIETKSSVASGAALKGSFVVTELVIFSVTLDKTPVKFKFKRKILSEGADYEFTCSMRS